MDEYFLSGHAQQPCRLTGALSPISGLNGTISDVHHMVASMTVGNIEIKDKAEEYTGTYTLTPHTVKEQVLNTNGRLMKDDVVVHAIPVWETSNTMGTTFIIGGMDDGV